MLKGVRTMYKIIMCIIVAVVVMLLILQLAENAALCFTDEEKRQIKAAVKQLVNKIYERLGGLL
mgnify:CR=1 FL=1